jgi:hypothetical protein
MENEEEVVDTTIENDNSQIVEEEQPQIESEVQTELTVDDYNALKAEKEALAKEKAELERKNKQLFERAKRPKDTTPLKNNELSPDEIRLIAKGVADDDIAYLKRIQAGYKAMGETPPPLSKIAEEDPGYLALAEKRAKEERSAKASLGGSGRSMSSSDVPAGLKPGSSTEDHKKVFEQSLKELGLK